MASPRVSVILPFFNAEQTLQRAIASIEEQTFRDWELIAFDDGSSDTSRRLANAAAAADARIRVIPSGHVGIVEALRRGCGEGRGEFLARMDADDVSLPERLERQLALMDAKPDAALCGARVRMTGERIGPGRRRYEAWINALVSHEDMVRELFVECPIPHPSFLLRREAYEAVGGYEDHGWAEDYDLVMRLWQSGAHLAKEPAALLEWHEAPMRLSMRDARYSAERFRTLKRHYLTRTYLAGRPGFHQWGAGEVGKLWLREWEGARPEAVVDINPRKIGRVIHDVPVIAPEALPAPGKSFVVVAVGAPSARDEIRAWLNPRGYRELEDYLFLA